MSRTNKRWSRSEDKYLRLALKDGLSAEEVSRNLGRSRGSVSNRKMILGLKGRFSRFSASALLRAAEKANGTFQPTQIKKEIRKLQPTEIFELESGIEVPSRFTVYSKEREKLRNTFRQMQVGQSFVITSNLVGLTRILANTEFPEMQIKIVSTSEEKKFSRVFRKA